MHNFVQELGLFLWAVIAHWQSYVTGGVVTAGVNVYERIKGSNIPWRWYIAIFVLSAGLVAFFYAWHDEHRNALVLIDQKAAAYGDLGICNTDRSLLSAKVDFLQSQIGATQQTINNQQATLNAQQVTLSSQQNTVNTCVVKLSERNRPLPLHTAFVRSPVADKLLTGYKHVTVWIALTNKEVSESKIQIESVPLLVGG